MHDSNWDDVLQTLECSDSETTAGPWTGERHVQPITICIRGEFGIRLCGNPVSEDGGFANEPALDDIIHGGEMRLRG